MLTTQSTMFDRSPLHDTSKSVGGGALNGPFKRALCPFPMSPFQKLYMVALDYNTIFTLVCILASIA